MDMNEPMNKTSNTVEALNRIQENARGKLSDMSNRLMDRSRAAASSTDAYVRENTWSSLALAAIIGVVVGLMIRRS